MSLSDNNNNVLRCLCIEDCQVGKATPGGGFFSGDLLPSLGANSNRLVALRKYIISPFDRRYRAWEMFLVILVIYSAWISPFDFAFLGDEGGLRIFDNIVNGFFAIDIILTFFVAYLETQSYVLSTWFIFDVSSTVPFRSLGLLSRRRTNCSSCCCKTRPFRNGKTSSRRGSKCKQAYQQQAQTRVVPLHSTSPLPKVQAASADSLEDLLLIAGEKFGGKSFAKVVSSENAEIEDLSVIRDGDHLFFLPNDCES